MMPSSSSLFGALLFLLTASSSTTTTTAFVPLIDGGRDVPKLYDCFFSEQLAKQAASAVSRAVGSGKKNIEVNFPPVPNVEEVKFGTPQNLKLGKNVVARDLKLPRGYVPGSYISRNLISYSNIYWAKKIAPSLGGGLLGKPVNVFTAEPMAIDEVKDKGSIGLIASISRRNAAGEIDKNNPLILVNPGGEETWAMLRSSLAAPSVPTVVLNNSYSTTYGLGNKCGFEEAYYLKRISKGWIYRSFPGPWQAYLEAPDGKLILLGSYKQKPQLNEVATLVREESFKRYAIFNDRWSKGFGERL